MKWLLLNLMLGLAWLVLTTQWTPLNFLIGLLIGFLTLGLVQRAAGRATYLRKVQQISALTGYFLWELVVANLRVAYDVLAPVQSMRPAVVAVPLDLRGEAQISLLANLISLTPGTLSLDVSPDRRTLYVHTMHLSSREEFVAEIKNGFERYVREVFA
mgnify:FL=1